MTDRNHDIHRDADALLDRAAAQIAAGEPDGATVQAAADRVWGSLSATGAQEAAEAAEVADIRGCDDYQALIPAYLAGTLPAARKLLLEDHTRECVPCRRALMTARDGEPVAPGRGWRRNAAKTAETGRGSRSGHFLRWAIAAALIAGIGVAQYVIREMRPFAGPAATVASVDGDLFRVAATSHLPIEKGTEVREGESVRTGREGGAVIALQDGSLVEMRARSEIAIDEGRRGTTIELARGSVIVQAAKQRQRHLYVATDDCLVSVTGTIFSVNHGTKGSRVAVIEGEVRVDYSGDEAVLRPGQQLATRSHLDPVPLEKEIAWSRDVDHYLDLLAEYSALRREIRDTVPRPGVRYTSRLLDLLPEGTVFYAAVPNLSDTLTETHRVLNQRLEDSPALAEWWQLQGNEQFAEVVDELFTRLDQLGDELGEELVVSGQVRGAEEFAGPLVLAEIQDAGSFQAYLEAQLQELPFADHGDDLQLTLVDDPAALPADGGDGFYLWLHDDLLVGSAEPEQIRGVAEIVLDGATSGFVGTPFYDSIAEIYQEGAGILIAADLEGVMANTVTADPEADPEQLASLEELGVLDARHLIVEQKQLADATHHRAVIDFKGARRGIVSWLAEPAPMGSLGFISPDAKLVTAVVFEDPVKMLDDLQGFGGDGMSEMFQLFEQRHGLSLRDDFAASLGGELAIALDGPMLPEPSWKVVLEVYDPARFQWTLQEALADLNAHLAEEGEGPVEILQEEVGGRTFYTFVKDGISFRYTFVEGYLVAAPNRALLDQAIRYHDSGYSITEAPRFVALLPADGHNNFSALVYQDVGNVMQALAEGLAQAQGEALTPEQQAQLDAMKTESSPTLGYAYGEEDRIILAGASEGNALSSLILRLLGVKNPAGIEQLLADVM
jgi:hypothetical protein